MSNVNSNTDKIEKRPSSARRKWYLLGLTACFLLAGVVWAAYYFAVAQFYATTSDAYVKGNRVQLFSQIKGTVTTIRVDDNDFVKAGEVLVRLDPTEARQKLQHAKADLADTVRSVRQFYAQLAEQKSIIKQREASLTQAKRDYQRGQRLLKSKSMSRQSFEQARTTYKKDQALLAAAKHKLSELQAQTHGTTLRDHPKVKQAESQLRLAYLDLQRTKILAPATGHIAQRNVQVGERVNDGKALLSIVPLNQVWVDANFKETELAAMRIGQPATVTSDFYGNNVTYHGHVAGISAGTGDAFELLPPQNASGNWIKIVRRVPVRIALDDPDQLKQYPLRLGLSMSASVNLKDTSGERLTRKSRQKPRYHTGVYEKRLQEANAVIKGIIQANSQSATASSADS